MSLPVYLVDDDDAVREAITLLLRRLQVRSFASPDGLLQAGLLRAQVGLPFDLPRPCIMAQTQHKLHIAQRGKGP